MTYKIYAALALVPFVFAGGCATEKIKKDPPPEKERLLIVDLKNSMAETNMRLEELNNKFMLLQEKVMANAEKTAALKKELKTKEVKAPKKEPAKESPPPKGLRVITLEDLEATETEAAEPTVDEIYNEGQDLFLSGKYKAARRALKTVVEKFPGHHLADNALYWSGESYYATEEYEMALLKFKTVMKKYPGENKAPAALLKIGYSYIELENPEKAARAFKELIKLYPDSEAAYKARKKLKEISK